ncbi:MAG: hypothetical protein KC996_08820 [Phycisphaerales bacterium]|nr:hypothetical protein [Phycisphaerales bacterium]
MQNNKSPNQCGASTSDFAPVPTGITRLSRTFLLWQIWRFIWINLKMIRMIGLSHKCKLPDES